MNLYSFSLFFTYTTIIVILLWARFRFFRIVSKKSRHSSYFYDPVAALHIGSTVIYILIEQEVEVLKALLGVLAYLLGLFLFIKSALKAKCLNYAFGDKVNRLITTGPYKYIRHPLYVSYSMIWITSTLLFSSWLLWITLVYLLAFYYFSAKAEEKAILKGSFSREYEVYRQNVGMFLPRITKWIN